MTPKFTYDPQQHCLREVARLREPVKDIFKSPRGYELAVQAYHRHLASLRVINCAPDTKWPEGEIVEGVDFRVKQDCKDDSCPPYDSFCFHCSRSAGCVAPFVAFPITKPPRTFTLAEALEIWDECERQTWLRAECINDSSKEQYFKTRFNQDI